MKIWTRLVASLALFGLAGVANAGMIQLVLDNEVSGSGGELTSPLIVTIDDGGTAGSVVITIDWSANTNPAEYLAALYLNFDPALSGLLGDLVLTDTSGPATSSFSTGENAFQADGVGLLDILIEWPTNEADRFNGGETYVGEITDDGAGVILASSFEFLSADPKGGQCAVARARGLGEGGENSGWFDCDLDEEEIVEPGSLALFGLGIGLLGFFGRRRRIG